VFDGSASTGKIKTYKWTLNPTECPNGPGKWSKEEKNFTAQILCSMNVVLEVTDGKKTHREKTAVTVRPRAWNTETKSDTARASMIFASNLMAFGKNRCQDANHFEDNPGDFIHRADKSNTWLDEAYGIVQVEDQGPFGGYWYLDRGKVQLIRNEFINSGLVDRKTPLYQLNLKNLKDLNLIADQVRTHERFHSELMIQALRKGRDPATEIEPLLHRDFDELQKKADDVIRAVNDKIGKATEEDRVKEKLRKITRFRQKACIITVDEVRKCFPDLADVDDVRGH